MPCLWKLLILFSAVIIALPIADRAAAQTPYGRIIVQSGVVARQVLQRGQDGKAAVHIAGHAMPTEGSLLDYRIMRRQQIVEGFDWRPIPLNGNGSWSIDVKGIPTGGPFDFEFRLRDSQNQILDLRRIDNVLVGDLWVTTGQSNMDGNGDLAGAEPPSAMVHDFSLGDSWQVAEDPIYDCYEAVYPVYLTSYVTPTQRRPIPYTPRGPWPTWKPAGNLGTSLGISFGKEIEQQTGVPIGLILCSLGGSSMDQWSPALKDEGGKSLYGAMMLRIKKVGGKVRGVLWYQGVSDSSGGASATYKQKLLALVGAIRSDLDGPNLPFYTVQIGRQIVGVGVSPAEKNTVREAQRVAMAQIPHAGLTTAIDLDMSSSAHLDSDGYKRVGRRLAKLALAKAYGDSRFESGPQLKQVSVEGLKHETIRIQFDQVNGRLIALPRVLGFSIRNKNGSAVAVDYVNAMIDPHSIDAVLIHVGQPIPADATLWYGYGWNPICNLVDAEDMAAPAFGPIPLLP